MKCLLCGRTYKVFSSFTSHVSHSHPGVSSEDAYSNDVIQTCNSEAELYVNLSTDESPNFPPTCTHDVVEMTAANFIVGLKEKYMVSYFLLHEENINANYLSIVSILNTSNILYYALYLYTGSFNNFIQHSWYICT